MNKFKELRLLLTFDNSWLLLLSVNALLLLMLSCKEENKQTTETIEAVRTEKILVERTDTCDLIILYPHYNKIDLVCGNMPEKRYSGCNVCSSMLYRRMYKKI